VTADITVLIVHQKKNYLYLHPLLMSQVMIEPWHGAKDNHRRFEVRYLG
jgi:hypothetical protein